MRCSRGSVGARGAKAGCACIARRHMDRYVLVTIRSFWTRCVNVIFVRFDVRACLYRQML